MRTIIKIYDRLIVVLAWFAGATIVAAFLLIIYDVTVRTLGFSPPAYTIAVVEYLLLYFTISAAPYLLRQKGHVFIDVLILLIPGRIRYVLEKSIYVVCILSTLTFSWISLNLAFDAIRLGTMDVRGIDFPQWIIFLPLPVGFLLVAIEFFRYLVGVDSMYSGEGDGKVDM